MTNEIQQQTPTTNHSRTIAIVTLINVVIFAVMYFVYDHQLPGQVASHYNIKGEADDTMAKWSFWLLYGGLGIVLPIVLAFTRRIDPRKQNYEKFNSYFSLMLYTLSLFMHGIMLAIILDNLNNNVPIVRIIVGAVAVLWIVIGNGMGQLRSNYFIGLRMPWTLSSEQNWKLTHRVSARLWVLSGILLLLSACLLNNIAMAVTLGIVIVLSIVVPFIYSYRLYKKGI
jgi:uncharacterized membrane protein